MKMCMWSFGGDKINFDRISAFKLSIFWQLLHYGVGTLLKSTSSTFYGVFFSNKA